MCVCVCVCVRERERDICVCERERESVSKATNYVRQRQELRGYNLFHSLSYIV